MQLNNFEKQTQQKLNNREIKPSANSWDRLDAMLSVEEKPMKKGFFWINIAASFIVFASIGYYFYNQNAIVEPVKEEQIIVEVEKNLENREEKIENREEKHEVIVENNTVLKETQNSLINNQKVVAVSETNNHQPSTNNQQEVSIINQQIVNTNQKVVAENSKKNTQNAQTNSPKYISAEKLLAEVSGEDFKNKKTENKEVKKRISVNPNALLSNAEKELNKTYRETALEKLNRNFNSVKTVLANRNYEDEF